MLGSHHSQHAARRADGDSGRVRSCLRESHHTCRRGLHWLGGHSLRPLVDESASTAGRGDIRAVNRAVAVSAAIRHGQAGSVVVARMALQAQGRFAQRQQVRVRRSVSFVAIQATFRDGRMLVGEWPAILRMAAQTEAHWHWPCAGCWPPSLRAHRGNPRNSSCLRATGDGTACSSCAFSVW